MNGEALVGQSAASVPATGTNLLGGSQFQTDDLGGINLDVTVSNRSGTSPTLTIAVQRQSGDGNFYDVYNSGALDISGANTTPVIHSKTIGLGYEVNKGLGGLMRVLLTVGGTSAPTATVSGGVTSAN